MVYSDQTAVASAVISKQSAAGVSLKQVFDTAPSLGGEITRTSETLPEAIRFSPPGAFATMQEHLQLNAGGENTRVDEPEVTGR